MGCHTENVIFGFHFISNVLESKDTKTQAIYKKFQVVTYIKFSSSFSNIICVLIHFINGKQSAKIN